MSERNPARMLFTVAMNVLVVLAIALTVRLVVLFFGQLAAQGWAEAVVALTDPITLPLGVDPIKTPYGGVFDVAAAVTIVVLLGAEWLLSILRSRA